MSKSKKGNRAGDTKTTSEEYVKRETGDNDVPKVPAEKPGNTSPNCDDLENPGQNLDNPPDDDRDEDGDID